MPPPPAELTLARPDGVRLAVHVREAVGPGPHPTVVLVHGYPDNHRLWDAVVDHLPPHLRVAAYDVRGAGASTAPTGRRAYALEVLAADLAAVCRHVAAGDRAHVVGHDWGGIQALEAATTVGPAGAMASLTAMSAASLDHVGRWARSRLRPGRRLPAGLLQVADQTRRAWHVGAVQLPLAGRAMALAAERGLIDRIDGLDPGSRPTGGTAGRDAANGVALYRSNARRLLAPRRGRVHVPLQVLVGRDDPFVSPHLHDDLGRWAPGAQVLRMEGGHWLPVTHPEAVAREISGFVARVEDGHVPV